LTLAKADSSDEPQIQTSRVDLSAVTEEVVATATAMAHESDIHIQTDLVSGQWVDADQNLLRLMLLNLLDNAVKFSPQQGTIHLFLRPDGDRVRLRVQDEGPGVEPADRDRIFERFYRGGGSRASGTGAGGLGLSVVSWVVESLGGSIRLLDPDTPGATFEVELPKASA
jgi:signal transduction histidine kinase